MSTQPKYLLLWAQTTDSLMAKINQHSEEYSLREITPAFEGVVASMGLREESKYDNVEAFKRMPITDEWTMVPEGVEIIHHTSKEMIVTKKQSLKLSVIRECLVDIFNIAEDNDTLDPSIMVQVYKLSEKALNLLENDNSDGEDKTINEQAGVGV